MMPKKFAHRRLGRYRTGRRRSRNKSILGSLFLEVIAIITLLIILVSKHEGDHTHPSSKDRLAHQSTEFSSMLTGYFSDQLDRHQLKFWN